MIIANENHFAEQNRQVLTSAPPRAAPLFRDSPCADAAIGKPERGQTGGRWHRAKCHLPDTEIVKSPAGRCRSSGPDTSFTRRNSLIAAMKAPMILGLASLVGHRAWKQLAPHPLARYLLQASVWRQATRHKDNTSMISDKGKPEAIRGRKATGPADRDSRAAEGMRTHLGGNRSGEIARSPLFGTKKGLLSACGAEYLFG